MFLTDDASHGHEEIGDLVSLDPDVLRHHVGHLRRAHTPAQIRQYCPSLKPAADILRIAGLRSLCGHVQVGEYHLLARMIN